MTTTNLGQLAVNLTADTNPLIKGFNKASKATKSFVKRIRENKQALVDFGKQAAKVAGGAAAGLTGLGLLAKNFAETEAASIRFARGIGLTAAQLQNYQRAAAQVGVESDTIRDALLELARRSSEATTGTGSLYDALQILRLDADKFVKLKLSDQFTLITRELDKLTNTAQKAFLTDEIFGGASDAITGLTGQIRDAANEANRLGKGLSGEDANSILALDSTFKELTASLSAISKQFLIDVSPVALEAVKGLEALLELTGASTSQNAYDEVSRRGERSLLGSVGGFLNDFRNGLNQDVGELISPLFMTQRELQTAVLPNENIQLKQLRALEKFNKQKAIQLNNAGL